MVAAAANMGQVGAGCAGGGGAADGMTSGARLSTGRPVARPESRPHRPDRSGRLPLSICPGIKRGGVFCNDKNAM